MVEQHARGDLHLREQGIAEAETEIILHVAVKVDPTRVHESHGGKGGNNLGKRSGTEFGVDIDLLALRLVRVAVAVGVGHLAVLDDSHAHAHGAVILTDFFKSRGSFALDFHRIVRIFHFRLLLPFLLHVILVDPTEAVLQVFDAVEVAACLQHLEFLSLGDGILHLFLEIRLGADGAVGEFYDDIEAALRLLRRDVGDVNGALFALEPRGNDLDVIDAGALEGKHHADRHDQTESHRADTANAVAAVEFQILLPQARAERAQLRFDALSLVGSFIAHFSYYFLHLRVYSIL